MEPLQEMKCSLNKGHVEPLQETQCSLNKGHVEPLQETKCSLNKGHVEPLQETKCSLNKGHVEPLQETQCYEMFQTTFSGQEHELVDLLSQYEDEEKVGGMAGYLITPNAAAASSLAYQPLSMESSHPMDSVYKAMAVRVAEEEQTQRTMIALNEMKPTYPGKTSKELTAALNKVLRAASEAPPL